MRRLLLSSGVVMGLCLPALAQTDQTATQVPAHPASRHRGQAGLNSETGARPGHEPGVGESLPYSTRASNLDRSDTRSTIAPTLPTPPVPPDAGPREFLQAARSALARGQTGEAQQALEMAETRALDRSVPYMQTNSVDRGPLVTQIDDALRRLGAGDRVGAMQAIESAIPLASQ